MTREDLIIQRATTCRHGGHCEWVACDKCNHYEPDVLNQQPCEDCISRQEALNVVHKYFEHYLQLNDDICLDGLRSLPSVTPKEKTGHWVNDEFGSKCSCCGRYTHLDKFDRPMKFMYCSMCGAKMEVSE